MKVQDQLEGTENRISTTRQDYNKAVQEYNTTRNSFPAVITAGLLGFKQEPFFQADPASRSAPDCLIRIQSVDMTCREFGGTGNTLIRWSRTHANYTLNNDRKACSARTCKLL